MRFLFLIFVFLIGCSSEKQIQRAKNRLSANPLEAAAFCSASFPNKETIIYRDSLTLDTIYLELERVDTLIENDTVRIITTSPAKVITKTLVKYKEVQVENTAKIEEQRQLLIKCEGRYDALQKKFEKSEEQRKAWRKKFYWIIFVILGFAVGYVLKQPALSSILKKTIKNLKRG
jgi:hypothetical protein